MKNQGNEVNGRLLSFHIFELSILMNDQTAGSGRQYLQTLEKFDNAVITTPYNGILRRSDFMKSEYGAMKRRNLVRFLL